MRSTCRSLAWPAGMTLVETLIVLAISAFVVAYLGGAMSGLRRTNEVKQSAMEFQSMVAEASRVARMERSPTRIALVIPDNIQMLEKAGVTVDKNRFQSGCRILLFKVPGRHLPATVQVPPLEGTPSVPLARLPRFESMVGHWHSIPRHNSWKRWHHQTVIGGDLVDDWKRGGVELCSTIYQLNPADRWSADDQMHTHPLSIYPKDLEHSPYEIRLETQISSLPDTHSIQIKGMRAMTTSDLYQDTPLPHWIRQDSRPLDQAPTDESLPLPAIDFNEDGSLACQNSEVIQFHFSEAECPQTRWTVHIRTRDAYTWIE